MKSKIINRVRDQQESVRSYHFWKGVEDAAVAEQARRYRLTDERIAKTYPKRWWQFWR